MANNPHYHVYIQFTPLYQGCGGFVTADLNLLYLMTLILDDSKLVDWFDVYALPGSRQTTPEQLRISHCRYRVIAAGIDNRNRIIGIATNRPRLQSRSYHAEEVLLHRLPRSLVRILLARVNNRGELMPIDPCCVCSRLAEKRGVQIESLH